MQAPRAEADPSALLATNDPDAPMSPCASAELDLYQLPTAHPATASIPSVPGNEALAHAPLNAVSASARSAASAVSSSSVLPPISRETSAGTAGALGCGDLSLPSFTSERSDDSASSSVRGSAAAPPPLPPATLVNGLHGLAVCLYHKQDMVAEVRVLQDLIKALESEGPIEPGSSAARRKSQAMRRTAACLMTLGDLPNALQAARACVAESEILLLKVSCLVLHFG